MEPIDGQTLMTALAEVVRGLSIDESTVKDEPGVRERWSSLAAEVAAIHALGGEVEIPDDF